jgi:hypothetical protein
MNHLSGFHYSDSRISFMGRKRWIDMENTVNPPATHYDSAQSSPGANDKWLIDSGSAGTGACIGG